MDSSRKDAWENNNGGTGRPAGPVHGQPSLCSTQTVSDQPEIALPPQLERTAFEAQLRQFADFFEPVGPLEYTLVRDLARQAVAMETWNGGVPALQRERVRRASKFAIPDDETDDDLDDVVLASAVSAPDVQLAEHLAQRHTRAFYRALRVLQELQEQRKAHREATQPPPPENQFLTEASCEMHLQKRFERGCYECPRCGSCRGHYIVTRRCWECSGCKRQSGLRVGTVAADSPLPLVVWFSAIRLLLWHPSMTAIELKSKLGIGRIATVRSIARRITSALAEANASQLLAGLDVYYAICRSSSPESSALDHELPETDIRGVQELQDSTQTSVSY